MTRPIGTGRGTEAIFTAQSDPWYGDIRPSELSKLEKAGNALRTAIERTGQKLAPEIPRRRLSFEEQLALVASGRARIIEMPRA